MVYGATSHGDRLPRVSRDGRHHLLIVACARLRRGILPRPSIRSIAALVLAFRRRGVAFLFICIYVWGPAPETRRNGALD